MLLAASPAKCDEFHALAHEADALQKDLYNKT